jgi:cytochrome c oxidase subunit 2
MQADVAGTYLGACAEFCGAEHAWMRIVVVAEAPADFDAWDRHQREPAEQAPTTSVVARGETEFRTKTCISCHTVGGVGGARVAPDLTHLAQRKTLGAGVLANDPASLARWLREPQVVKPASHMPDLNLTDDEVNDLTAYLDTLR